MLEFYLPEYKDLWFRRRLLQDEQTMSYNHAWGGTIDFSEERWTAWYERWVAAPEGKRFYRYLRCSANGEFIGEAAYHFEEDRCLTDILIYAPYRRKGFGREALRLLCDAAKEQGVAALWDDIAADNPALSLFLQEGFAEVGRTETCVTVKKNLKEAGKDFWSARLFKKLR